MRFWESALSGCIHTAVGPSIRSAKIVHTWENASESSGNLNTIRNHDGAGQPNDPDFWTCPECGTTNHNNYCTFCGSPRPVRKDPFLCSCGHQNLANSKFCGNCGKELTEKKSSDFSGVLIVLALLLLTVFLFSIDWPEAFHLALDNELNSSIPLYNPTEFAVNNAWNFFRRLIYAISLQFS